MRKKAGEKTLDDLFSGGEFWENVDWGRTRAYAMGLGQIYPIVRQGVPIMDMAPTVLKYFGLQIPGDIDGQPLF